MYSWETEIQKN